MCEGEESLYIWSVCPLLLTLYAYLQCKAVQLLTNQIRGDTSQSLAKIASVVGQFFLVH